MPVPDPHREEEVKAYLQLREGSRREQVSPERVLAHCRERLEKFKLPRYLKDLDAFPYTSSSASLRPASGSIRSPPLTTARASGY